MPNQLKPKKRKRSAKEEGWCSNSVRKDKKGKRKPARKKEIHYFRATGGEGFVLNEKKGGQFGGEGGRGEKERRS